MKLETQKQIQELLKVRYPNDRDEIISARFLGMCQAMLTDEQAETMVSYIQKWIEEVK